jgi:NADPH2:quinone reductase
MRAIQITEPGGPGVLTPVDLPEPGAGPGELLVEVAAAGVNYIDTYQREGIYPMSLPYVPGLEGAGRVLALGPDVTDFAVGDRVAWSETLGSYAQRVAVPAEKAVAIPDAVSDEAAVGALLQGMTAHFLVHDTFPVDPGGTVLVHAAAGGVGLLLTQLLAARDVRVIATVSTAEKEAPARGAGAAEVIDYSELGGADRASARESASARVTAAVRSLTSGEGVAVAFDGVGRTTFDAGLASLRRRGGSCSTARPPARCRRSTRNASTPPGRSSSSAPSCSTSSPPATSSPRGPRRSTPTAPSTSGSGPATRWPRPARPTRTSRAAARPERCSSSHDR